MDTAETAALRGRVAALEGLVAAFRVAICGETLVERTTDEVIREANYLRDRATKGEVFRDAVRELARLHGWDGHGAVEGWLAERLAGEKRPGRADG